MAQPPYTGQPDGYAVETPPGESGISPPPAEAASSESVGGLTHPEPGVMGGGGPKKHDAWLLQKAQAMYTVSTDYMTANVTKTWERSLAHFRNEHAPGTNYRRTDWRRSRTFRPKTRSSIKAAEANLFAAAFSTQDFLVVTPQDTSNQNACVGAAVLKELTQWRLQTTLKWMLTSLGQYQDTKVYGVCISHQHWEYNAQVSLEPALQDDGSPIFQTDEDGSDVLDDTGEKIPMGSEKTTVISDRPRCDDVEPENFRFDPMCDWRDPANTSQYLIYTPPMPVSEVLEMMDKVDRKTGQPIWRRYDMAAILSTRVEYDNRTRQAREGMQRIDPVNSEKGNEFTTVWPHLNILRVDGQDIAWWTMGTELVLSDPILLQDMYPHLRPGERPFVVGFSNIEAHRNFPSADAEQGATLQMEINDLANQRMDNVKLALNKRYFVRRGSQIDLDALIRNVPGGGVMVNDPEKDINVVSTPDVTASSYQEQVLLSTDYDELLGGFSQGSVSQSRKMNETKAGMEMVQASAGSVSDYSINLFFETWMVPVLQQIIRMEAMYETDERILAIGAKRASLMPKFGVDKVTDDMLREDMEVTVNVGVGNTNPMQRVQKLLLGVGNVVKLPGMIQRIKSEDIANEIFGSLGYKNADRFFMSDAEWVIAQKKMPPPQPPPEIAIKEKELALREQDQTMRHRKEQIELAQDYEVAMAQIAAKNHMTMEQIYSNHGIKQAENQTNRDAIALKESNRLNELNNNRLLGAQ